MFYMGNLQIKFSVKIQSKIKVGLYKQIRMIYTYGCKCYKEENYTSRIKVKYLKNINFTSIAICLIFIYIGNAIYERHNSTLITSNVNLIILQKIHFTLSTLEK